MKQITIELNKDEALQIRRGESIRAQVGDFMITIKGPTKQPIKRGHNHGKTSK